MARHFPLSTSACIARHVGRKLPSAPRYPLRQRLCSSQLATDNSIPSEHQRDGHSSFITTLRHPTPKARQREAKLTQPPRHVPRTPPDIHPLPLLPIHHIHHHTPLPILHRGNGPMRQIQIHILQPHLLQHGLQTRPHVLRRREVRPELGRHEDLCARDLRPPDRGPDRVVDVVFPRAVQVAVAGLQGRQGRGFAPGGFAWGDQ